MRKIKVDDKVLAIVHGDMDGAACGVVLKNCFEKIDVIPVAFGKVDYTLKCIDYSKYDHVFVADLHPEDPLSLDISDKIILLDHHESAEKLCDPKRMRYVLTDGCGCMLVKKFLSNYFHTTFSNLDYFCEVVNDYDMWIRKNPKSTMLNDLFQKYYVDIFMKRFLDGKIRFTESEFKYLKARKKLYDSMIDDMDIHEIKEINGCAITVNDFTNEISSKLLSEGYSFVFAIHPKSYHVSVRHNIDGVNIGEILTTIGIGGGHILAGGFNQDNEEMALAGILKTKEFLEKELKGKNV